MASLLKNLADKYDSATEYVVGDRTVRNGHMYICTANTTGEFDSESWREIYLTDLMRGVNSNLKSNEITKIPGNNRIDAGTTLQEICVLNCEGKSTITFTPIGYGNYGNGIIALSVYGANTLNEAMVGNYNISCTDRELIQTINFNSGIEYSVNISGYKYVSFSAKNNNNAHASVDLTHVQLS